MTETSASEVAAPGRHSSGNVQHSATVRHLYVHIPFCARICPYCAFYKEQGDPTLTGRFCRALLAEAEMLQERFAISAETIFFGGGTPTALSTAQLEMVLRGVAESFDVSALSERKMEANQGSDSL